MSRIEQLKNTDLDQIPKSYADLQAGIRELLQDYEKETDKTVFEQEAAENIVAYLDLVKQVAPTALGKTEKAPKKKEKYQGKNRNILLEYHNRLLDIAIDYEGEKDDALKGMLEDALGELNKVIEEEQEDKAIPMAVHKASGPLYTLAEMTEQEGKRSKDMPEAFVATMQESKKAADALLAALGRPREKAHDRPKKLSKEGQPNNGKGKDKDKTGAWQKKVHEEGNPSKKRNKEPDNPDQKTANPTLPLQERIQGYEKDIEACRAVIREYNRKKRESQPERPKPTRRTLLKKKMLAIVKLTPEPLAGDPAVQAENRNIVKATIRAFMKNWGMTNTRPIEKAIDREFDEIEEHLEEKEQQGRAHRWGRDLPATETIIAFEKKHNKHLLEEAALQMVQDITEAIALYKAEPKKAFRFLQAKFDTGQLQAYLPAYILEEMTANSTRRKK